MRSDDDENNPPTITDAANVILDSKLPGIYIQNPTELTKLRKRKVAGYCGFKLGSEYHDFYQQPEIKEFCCFHDPRIENKYGIDELIENKKRKQAWSPSGTMRTIFWLDLVPNLHLDLDWIKSMEGRHQRNSIEGGGPTGVIHCNE